MTMKNKNLPLYELLFLLIGEVIVSLIVCAVYLIISTFTPAGTVVMYKVITGTLLGTAVIFLNFLFLALSTNRIFTEAEEARGTREMSEEEITDFVKEHQARYDNMVKISFFARNLSMLLALVLAFVLDWFDVIATLVPLMMYRPILTIAGLINNKKRKEDK